MLVHAVPHWKALINGQGHRKVSNIGVEHTYLDPRSAENTEGAQVLDTQNIGGACAPVPPLFLRP